MTPSERQRIAMAVRTKPEWVGQPRPIPQLEFITPEAEAELLAQIHDAMMPLRAVTFPGYSGRSRLRRYGWDYNDTQKRLEDFPPWLAALAEKVGDFDSAVINEYVIGSSIAPHIDSKDFGDPIQILSLGSPATMDFKRKCCALPFSIVLPPRSLLTLTGDYRWNWTHALKPVKALRYSIVFRKRILK